MTHVIRATITFPGRASDGGISSIGIPGPESLGNGLVSTPSIARHRLDIALMDNGDPLVGIGIAPDSPIEACTVYLEGSEHRVCVGSPLVADFVLTATSVDVTIPISIPAIPVAQGTTQIRGWDAVPVTLDTGAVVLGWTLRLELYYGGVPPRAARATYHSRVAPVHTVDGANSITYFLLDGRHNAEVQVLSPAPNGNMWLRIGRSDGIADPADPRFDSGSLSFLVPGEPVGEDDPGAVPLALGLTRIPLPTGPLMPSMIAVSLVGEISDQPNAGTYQIVVTAE